MLSSLSVNLRTREREREREREIAMEVLMGFLFFSLLICSVFLANLVHAQDTSGSINIDCGTQESYTDATTNTYYSSDSQFIDTGQNRNISAKYRNGNDPRLVSLRNFPEGLRNCYTLRPEQGKGNNYLIRASFLYGNYNGLNRLPSFDLYIGVNVWDTVQWSYDAINTPLRKEIVYAAPTDYIQICLVNTGSGTPFISALELRHLNNSIYNSQSGCMVLYQRYDVGTYGADGQLFVDKLGRIWTSFNFADSELISAKFLVDTLNSSDYQLPPEVMSVADKPANATFPLLQVLDLGSASKFYIYLHFCELQKLRDDELREFEILVNDVVWVESVIPSYLISTTVTKENSVSGGNSGVLMVAIQMTRKSTLPPILNAMEFYVEKELLQSPTEQEDFDAIMNITSTYGVKRNWDGDPCVPENFLWDGLNCSYHGVNSPQITSLNLSSSRLTGKISPYLSNLKSLHYLDLSNNSLTGSVPEFLSQLSALKILNLSWNNLTGSIPMALIEKYNQKLLSLSVEGNPNLCWSASCKAAEKKKNPVIVPIVAFTVSSAAFLGVIAILLVFNRRRQQARKLRQAHGADRSVESKNRRFTYSEVLSITNDFERVIGKGGFGTVYLGRLENGTLVAVKMLSRSTDQGSEQFWTEAELLTRVHHRNLVSLIGYCDRGPKTALVYEYMANGNLQEQLLDKDAVVLSWEQRLQIATDTAQALEYLHNGCKPPIIHRDIKTANILLNEKLQAKVADFGLSRILPFEDGQVSTAVVGTIGYLDPEYYTTSRLTEKSDVYSFGIVLLELITGLPPIVKKREKVNVVEWVMSMIERGELKDIVDPRLQGDFESNSVWKAVETAISCVPLNSNQRPNMSHVLGELKECLVTYKSSEQSLDRTQAQETKSSNVIVDLFNQLNFETSMSSPQARYIKQFSGLGIHL